MDRSIKNIGLGRKVPPLFSLVEIYFQQQHCSTDDASLFFFYYEQRGWRTKTGQPVRNWKTHACEWIWKLKHPGYLS